MTASEKEKIVSKMIKSVDKIAVKNHLSYRDLAIMVLNLAESIVRFCIREGVEGCKKNSRKLNKLTIETFTEYANRDTKNDSWWLKDDEDNNEKEQNNETEE